jgi:transposase-like protein
MEVQFKNLQQLLQTFSDEKVCRQYLEDQLWKGTPTCPKCGHQRSYKLNDGKTYKCASKECYKKYTVTVGTVFENTNIKLGTWFAAIYLCTAHKKGISSLQLSRDLGVTQKTAWFLLHRIREMMKEKAPKLLRNVVEVDETYIGGRHKNMHAKKLAKIPKTANGNAIDTKTAVVGICGKEGYVITEVVHFISRKNVEKIINDNLEKNTVVITDSSVIYKRMVKDNNYPHEVVNHKEGEYVRDGFHINRIEGFWSLLKRGIYGIYHQVSPKHLGRYCNEFGYRYNTREITDSERFALSVQNAAGRLTYEKLISSQP